MLAKYTSIIRKYVLSVSSKICAISFGIPLLANQDLTPMLLRDSNLRWYIVSGVEQNFSERASTFANCQIYELCKQSLWLHLISIGSRMNNTQQGLPFPYSPSLNQFFKRNYRACFCKIEDKIRKYCYQVMVLKLGIKVICIELITSVAISFTKI